MLVRAAQSVRHLVARLERGDTVHEALRSLAHAHHVCTAWVHALGALDAVSLAEYDQQARAYKPARSFQGTLEVLSLTGNLSLKDGEPYAHLHASVSRETDNGIEVLGGHLVSAHVFALELHVTVFDDVAFERVHDPVTGLALWRAGEPPAPPPVLAHVPVLAPAVALPVPPVAVRAAPALEVLVPHPPATMPPRPERKVESDFGPEVVPGDFFAHPQWGEVEVEKEIEPGRFQLRLPSGSARTISIEVFDVSPQPAKDGHQVFQLRPRRR